MTVQTDQIKTIRQAKDGVVLGIRGDIHNDLASKMLITSGRWGHFKTAYGWLKKQDGGLILNAETARALGISEGDRISYVPRES